MRAGSSSHVRCKRRGSGRTSFSIGLVLILKCSPWATACLAWDLRSLRQQYAIVIVFFLDGFERFSSYVKTGLIDLPSLRPYIGYWIDDISSPTENADDAAWCAALLTYISFYRFDGVLWLFDAFGRSIRPSSPTYISFLKLMADQELASQLAGTVKCEYPPAR